MEPSIMWLFIAVGIVAIVAGAWYALRKRRTQQLRDKFKTEYEHAVRHEETVAKAEATLEARARRVAALQIHPLSPSEADRFGVSWRAVQARFVDDPREAVTEADRLIGEVMAARGYPVGEFEQRVADISVDHPDVVMNYRAARDIATSHARGEASTEDLRQAMVHYGALFSDLLETRAHAEEPRTHTMEHRK